MKYAEGVGCTYTLGLLDLALDLLTDLAAGGGVVGCCLFELYFVAAVEGRNAGLLTAGPPCGEQAHGQPKQPGG